MLQNLITSNKRLELYKFQTMAGTVSLCFSVLVVFLIVIGVLDVITNYEDNRCEMTYMFERPEYLVNRVCIAFFPVFVVSLNYFSSYCFFQKLVLICPDCVTPMVPDLCVSLPHIKRVSR